MSQESGQPDSWKKSAVGGGLFHPMGLYKVPCGTGTADLGARATNDHVDTLSNGVCLADLKMDGNVL